MKHLQLVCNSYIDPIWQWGWDEGISATLSTPAFKKSGKLTRMEI